MRSVLSTLRNLAAKFTTPAAPQFTSPREETKTNEQPRLMVEVLGPKSYGLALLYVPDEGLFFVKPDGTTHCIRAHVLMAREGADVIFPMHYPVGENHTIRFAGPGSESTYCPTPDKEATLVELPSGKFGVTWSVDPDSVGGFGRKYHVTLR